ncbi:MAG TPA: nodulation protein NfeD [Candidatus Eisenbacteria bacterium]|nr:nodulation protein NfeD [Candidatus Eisenbacteria bacterium]
MKRLTRVVLAVAFGLAAEARGAVVSRIVVDGAINPAVAGFIQESIARANDEGAAALVIVLDTPGGLLTSARAIVKDILAAPLPVIVYVAPSGAGAGSAGVFVTMAAHVAAMAPGTSIGAAHPVGGQGEDIKGTLGEKIENFTASFSEAIARQRGRNVEWAIKAVRQSVSAPADEAARLKVVDFVAKDIEEVAARADGRTVDVGGAKQTLHLRPLELRDYEMRFSQRVLNVLADPNIAYLLMMAGVLGLYIEFTHPGVLFPGIAGAICLLLAMTAMQVLPLNYGALALIVLGMGLLVAEAFLPTFGVVGVGGAIALILGSLFLFDSAGDEVQVARSLILGAGGGLAVFVLLVGAWIARRRAEPGRLGAEGMIGAVGVARERLAPVGTVLVNGEYWTAEAEHDIDAGLPVEVTGVAGLRLRVRAAAGRAR